MEATPETITGAEYTEELLVSAANRLFHKLIENSEDWTSEPVRHVLHIKRENPNGHIGAAALQSSNGNNFPPFVFFNDIEGSMLAVYHLGENFSGHVGFIHGGVLCTLLDECMGRACFPKMPNKIGVTVRLEVDFKSPVRSGTAIAIHARTEKVDGRKAWVAATILDSEELMTLVEAKALFIEPRQAAEMPKLL